MRLRKFLSISTKDDDINDFRSLNLDLVEQNTGNIDLVKRITERFEMDDRAFQLLENANRELKRMYRGKLKFDFCLEEQGMTPDDVKIEQRKVHQLKEKWFKFNDALSNIQIDFEKSIKKVYKSNG